MLKIQLLQTYLPTFCHEYHFRIKSSSEIRSKTCVYLRKQTRFLSLTRTLSSGRPKPAKFVETRHLYEKLPQKLHFDISPAAVRFQHSLLSTFGGSIFSRRICETLPSDCRSQIERLLFWQDFIN